MSDLPSAGYRRGVAAVSYVWSAFGPSLRYPPVDFVSVKTEIAADLDKRKMTAPEQFVNPSEIDLQMPSQLADRH